jgi:endonuclease/exonuclease/phosphatase family metal-dependent hydrolase
MMSAVGSRVAGHVLGSPPAEAGGLWFLRLLSMVWRLLHVATMLTMTAPGRIPAETPSETLRVLSYNIHHGQGTDGRLDLPRLARVIAEVQPDLVALQEVDSGATRSGGIDQAALLGQLTGLTALYGPFMDFEGGSYGMALLSRWEVVRSRNVVLPGACLSCSCNPLPCPEGRASVVLVARSPRTGRQVVLAGVHLYQSEAERLAQARALTAALEPEQAPVLLVGDFNSQRGTVVMEDLATDWHVLEKEGPPETFPAAAPTRELDFVLSRKDALLELISHRVLPEQVASDHRPVLAEFRLK